MVSGIATCINKYFIEKMTQKMISNPQSPSNSYYINILVYLSNELLLSSEMRCITDIYNIQSFPKHYADRRGQAQTCDTTCVHRHGISEEVYCRDRKTILVRHWGAPTEGHVHLSKISYNSIVIITMRLHVFVKMHNSTHLKVIFNEVN